MPFVFSSQTKKDRRGRTEKEVRNASRSCARVRESLTGSRVVRFRANALRVKFNASRNLGGFYFREEMRFLFE